MNRSQPGPLSQVRIWRCNTDRIRDGEDVLAAEEPLEIQVSTIRNGKRRRVPISVTMRTPGHDRELAAGFLFTEGLIHDRREILAIQPCRQGNRVRVVLRDEVQLDLKRLKRHFYTSSSCGVCGKASIQSIRTQCIPAVPNAKETVSLEIIHRLPCQLRAAQAVFDRTGGLHACALFDSTGHLLLLREDVGRHNALDKLIGSRFLSGEPTLSGQILFLSGRVSFELVQKAAMAGNSVIAAVGAPSSLAVELAHELGITLLGFVRDERFNVYCGSERIRLDMNQVIST